MYQILHVGKGSTTLRTAFSTLLLPLPLLLLLPFQLPPVRCAVHRVPRVSILLLRLLSLLLAAAVAAASGALACCCCCC
jgi:hypothetical protein